MTKIVDIEYQVFNDIGQLKQILSKKFDIFDDEIRFNFCAFFFVKTLEDLQKFVFGTLDSILMDKKISKLDFIEATLNKEKRDSNGNFVFPEKTSVNLSFCRCYLGNKDEFDSKFKSVENLDEGDKDVHL